MGFYARRQSQGRTVGRPACLNPDDVESLAAHDGRGKDACERSDGEEAKGDDGTRCLPRLGWDPRMLHQPHESGVARNSGDSSAVENAKGVLVWCCKKEWKCRNSARKRKGVRLLGR